MQLMQIDSEIQKELWKIVCGLLYLGNIDFKREGDGFGSVFTKSKEFLEYAAELWGIKSEHLEQRLTTASLKVGGKSIVKKITHDKCETNKDSIAKGYFFYFFIFFIFFFIFFFILFSNFFFFHFVFFFFWECF